MEASQKRFDVLRPEPRSPPLLQNLGRTSWLSVVDFRPDGGKKAPLGDRSSAATVLRSAGPLLRPPLSILLPPGSRPHHQMSSFPTVEKSWFWFRRVWRRMKRTVPTAPRRWTTPTAVSETWSPTPNTRNFQQRTYYYYHEDDLTQREEEERDDQHNVVPDENDDQTPRIREECDHPPALRRPWTPPRSKTAAPKRPAVRRPLRIETV